MASCHGLVRADTKEPREKKRGEERRERERERERQRERESQQAVDHAVCKRMPVCILYDCIDIIMNHYISIIILKWMEFKKSIMRPQSSEK